MKILFVLPRYHTNQYFWTKTLQAHGHTVRYIVFEKKPSQEEYGLAEPIEIEHTPLPHFLQWLIRAYMQRTIGKIRQQFLSIPNRVDLKRQITTFAPDIVIIREVAFPLSLMSFYICKQLGIPTFLYNQYPLESSERPLTKLLQLVGLVPKRRITPTRHTADQEYNTKTGARYVPFVTDFAGKSSEKQYAKDGCVRILFVGKFVSVRKNHLLLLDALHRVKKSIDFHLVLAGDDTDADPAYLKKIQDRIHHHGLTDHVTLEMNIPYTQMHRLYQDADLFVLPSANEAFAISPIEAMNYALPVIVSDTNGARSCVTNGHTGYVVRTGDTADLAEKIVRIASNKNDLARMGRTAFLYHQQQHSPDAFYKQFMAAIVEKAD